MDVVMENDAREEAFAWLSYFEGVLADRRGVDSCGSGPVSPGCLSKLEWLVAYYRGIVDDDSDGIFGADGIKQLEDRELFRWKDHESRRPEYVFISCDPSGGGANHTALYATVRFNGQIIVRVCAVDVSIEPVL